MRTQFYSHRSGLRHDTGINGPQSHPECPERLDTVLDLLAEEPFAALPHLPAPEAEWSWLAAAHDDDYLMALQDAIPDHGFAFIDNDTILSPGSWDAAVEGAGAVCAAVADVLGDQTDRAFCAVRPPGHHAGPSKAEGFCLLNNIMIGALRAQKLGAAKVAIVDFDVHHGNGTEAMVKVHDNVFYASTHQWPLYPGTGGPDTDIPDRIINRPLAGASTPADFRAAYENAIFPAIERFAPDLLMISAGFDAHRDDPLAGLSLTEEDFAWVTKGLCAIAAQHCRGRIVSVLEGGYNLPALKSSLSAHLRVLAGMND